VLKPFDYLKQRHLERVLLEYATFYNQRRPHQGLANRIPDGQQDASAEGGICRRDMLGGIIHDYYREVA
jgi:hypothetical protein